MADLFTDVDPAVLRLLGDGPPLTSAYDEFPDPHHRTILEFWWQPGSPPLICIGQNPSKATRHRGDPTVTRCARRAYRMGLGGLVMLNMFARAETYPADLWAAPVVAEIEEQNLQGIARALRSHPEAPVLFAPGGDPHPRHQAQVKVVATLVREMGRPLMCLGVTQSGQPRHPSRLGYAEKMVVWHG